MNINTLKRTIKAIINLLLCDPYSIKFFHSWIKSLIKRSKGYISINDQVPWITFKAKEWLESYLKPNMSVFEYGSGGSTIFLSRRVNKLISIEHDKRWYRKVSKVLSNEGISNCEYILYAPEKIISEKIPSYTCKSYTSTAKKYAGMSFEKYVKSIEKYPDKNFDLVFVDGRARPSCIAHSLSKISPGGYLMLDDSEKQKYLDVISLLTDYKRINFFGFTLYRSKFKQTSVWKVNSIDKSKK